MKFRPPSPENYLQEELNKILDPNCAVTMVKLTPKTSEPLTNEEGRKIESDLVANIVNQYKKGCQNEGRVFCVTPHHLQRKAIINGVSDCYLSSVNVNTVECMQGQEAARTVR